MCPYLMHHGHMRHQLICIHLIGVWNLNVEFSGILVSDAAAAVTSSAGSRPEIYFSQKTGQGKGWVGLILQHDPAVGWGDKTRE